MCPRATIYCEVCVRVLLCVLLQASRCRSAVATLLHRLRVSFIIILLCTAMYVSSYYCLLLHMCPHTTLYCYVCVLILPCSSRHVSSYYYTQLQATAGKSRLPCCCIDYYMCPHTHTTTYCYMCVLILVYTVLCVLILQHATATGKSLLQRLASLPLYYICVRMLISLYICPLQQASRCCSGWPRCRFTRTQRAL